MILHCIQCHREQRIAQRTMSLEEARMLGWMSAQLGKETVWACPFCTGFASREHEPRTTNTDRSKDVKTRLENVITQGGKFPNAFAITQAIVEWNTKTIRDFVEKFKQMPEPQRRAFGIAANLLLAVLENELQRRTRRLRWVEEATVMHTRG